MYESQSRSQSSAERPPPFDSRPGPAFYAAVQWRHGGTRLRLAGELDLDARQALAATAGALPPVGEVDLELSGTPFLDPTGLHALMALHDALVDRGCTVRLVGPPPGALRLLDFAADHDWLMRPVHCPTRPAWVITPRPPLD